MRNGIHRNHWTQPVVYNLNGTRKGEDSGDTIMVNITDQIHNR